MSGQSQSPACLAATIVEILRGKWAMHILLSIDGPEGRHFSAIRRDIPGISAKVLTEQLGNLIAAGVVQRTPLDTARKEVAYSYTARGKELRSVLDSLNDLAQRWEKLRPSS